MDMQKVVDMMNKQMEHERAATQMTLGELISTLRAFHPDTAVAGVTAEADSYRGYYSDLAFEPGNTTVEDLLQTAESALGQVFEGYKGGEFVMTKVTPLWCANYGDCGLRVMAITGSDQEGLTVELAEDES